MHRHLRQACELGRATTHGQAPLGTDDPVIAARAVRRALAAAGRRAVDVTGLVVVSAEPIPADALAAFARRALGPHGSTVRTTGFTLDAVDAGALAEAGVQRADTGAPGQSAVLLVVGVGSDGEVEARCLAP